MTRRRLLEVAAAWVSVGSASLVSAEDAKVAVTLGTPGPWGMLETLPCVLAPPDWYLDAAGFEETMLEWLFPGFDEEKLRGYLAAIGFPDQAVADLLANRGESPPGGGLRILPPRELVVSMPRKIRSMLYADLARSPSNPLHQYPFSIDPRGFTHSAEGSGLPESIVSLVESMVYSKEGLPVFADLPLVLSEIPEESGRKRFISVLLQQESLMVRARLPGSPEDLQAMAAYWSGGSAMRESSLTGFLSSIVEHSNGTSIDLLYLLPLNARKLLNCYPPPESQVGETAPDCYWTAFNFFGDEVSDRALDPGMIDRYLENRYDPVEGEPTFSDVIVFSDPKTQVPMHACVYLADGLVYTKNGHSLLRPWMIMRLKDLAVSYWGEKEMVAHVFRRRRLQ